ncbi:MAG TPA: nucleotide exchange factor GrpE [Stellaceae bacterium]|nr:nucleotide exchange factor GrpE [Stellaceae bacterium]
MADEKNGAQEAQANGMPGEEAPSLEERLATAEAEAADAKDKLLRALAETENVRRRAQREREDAARYGAANLARDLINVADNLRRALASVPEGQATDELTRTVLQGVDATERELLAAFERHGIRRIDPMGERFDHNFHQAIMEVENSGQPGGTVVQVLQPGYAMHDRLLRPAMVGVAKGERRADGGTLDEVV